MTKWIGLIVFLVFFLLRTPMVFATTPAEFVTSLSATYAVDQRGATTVKNEIHIKNNFSTIYATQYALEVGSTKITNVRAYTLDGTSIPVLATQTEAKTSIALTFSDKVIGKDQERAFIIEYQHPDVAVLTGSVLEIDIPKLVRQDAFQTYVVRVEIPLQFATLAAASPPTYTTETTEKAHIYTFLTGAKQGINLIFGERQTFSFTLKYHVANPSISQGVVQVALPPDTSFQRMQYSSIKPQPDTIVADSDGNWIGSFTVGSQKEVEIVAEGIAMVYLKPTVPISREKPGKELLGDQSYWEVSNPIIQQRAKELQTPRAIYDYLVKSLSYNYARLNLTSQTRRGAVETLLHPEQALCEEFTDAFVAIARAAKVPTREVNGFAYTQNSTLRPLSLVVDVLHAWPEYFDAEKKIWVPVDPTWGNTTGGVDFFSKLDFNHIAFAIHGASSDKPYPAGVYKIPGKEEKDVYVDIAPNTQAESMQLSIVTDRTINGTTIIVENLTGSAWYDVPVSITTSSSLAVSKAWKNPTLTLLPFQKKQFQVEVVPSNLFVSDTGTVTVTVGGKSVTYETKIKRFNPKVAVGLGGAILAIITGCVLVLRKKR